MMINQTKEELELIVKCCYSVAEVCRSLGLYSYANGRNSRNEVKEYILSLGISTNHFKPNGKRVAIIKRKLTDELMFSKQVLQKGYSSGGLNAIVKKRLLALGKDYKCDSCGISEWNNKPITLQLEHNDGDRYNYEKDNLSFLCPNCHSQTKTYSAKKLDNNSALRYTEENLVIKEG